MRHLTDHCSLFTVHCSLFTLLTLGSVTTAMCTASPSAQERTLRTQRGTSTAASAPCPQRGGREPGDMGEGSAHAISACNQRKQSAHAISAPSGPGPIHMSPTVRGGLPRAPPSRFVDRCAFLTFAFPSPTRPRGGNTPLRYTPIRHTPLRYTPIRHTPLRYTPIRPTCWQLE